MAIANVAGAYESGLRTPQPLAGIANAIDQSGDSISDMIYKKHMEQLQAHTNQLIMDFQKQKQGAEFKQQSDLETQKQAGAMALQKAKMAGSNIDPAAMAQKIAQTNQAMKSAGLENYSAAVDPSGHVTAKQDFTRGEKESQFNQKEWDKIVKETNPLTASSRSSLGMAAQANLRADRAIVTLQQPTVTNQEAGNIMADIASIYQGGSPTQFGMSEQGYKTLYGSIQGVRQMITGHPQDAVTPEIKSRLNGVLEKLKGVNNGVISSQLDFMEKSKAKIIKAFPDEWQDIRTNLERGKRVYGDGSQSPSGQSLPAGAGTGGQQGQDNDPLGIR